MSNIVFLFPPIYRRNTMESTSVIPCGSLFYAPMEGVTDGAYRFALNQVFPEWDFYATDFLRIPRNVPHKAKKILEHFDPRIYGDSSLKKRTLLQILTSQTAATEETVRFIDELKFERLDLNLGCPSKRVNSHGGGARLLTETDGLQTILRTIRKHFQGIFTVKIRLGYRDSSPFWECLKIFEGEGVDAVTIHARTATQLYRGRADWHFIEKAVQNCPLPIVGNGDVRSLKDIKKLFEQTGCRAVMVGRGALQTPWLATWWRKYKGDVDHIEEDELLFERRDLIELFLHTLEREYRKKTDNETFILKRFKALARYLFEDFPHSDEVRRRFLHTQNLDQFHSRLKQLTPWQSQSF